MKWLQEVVLQRYWQDRCHEDEYLVDGRRVLGARMNPSIDSYPDIIENQLDGLERAVPAEVEWTTDDFRAHKHNVELLTENEGFLIVYKRTQAFPVPQVELRINHLRDWLEESNRALLDDTLTGIEKSLRRKSDPRGWLVWRSGSVDKHLEIGLEEGLWGFPDNLNPNRLANAQAIKKGDILIFIGPWRKRPGEKGIHGGRLGPDKFLRGILQNVSAYPVTRGYFEDDEIVWPSKGDEIWRHRVQIDPRPVFDGQDVPTDKAVLGHHLPEIMRRVMVGRSDPLEIPEHLLLSLLSALGRSR